MHLGRRNKKEERNFNICRMADEAAASGSRCFPGWQDGRGDPRGELMNKMGGAAPPSRRCSPGTGHRNNYPVQPRRSPVRRRPTADSSSRPAGISLSPPEASRDLAQWVVRRGVFARRPLSRRPFPAVFANMGSGELTKRNNWGRPPRWTEHLAFAGRTVSGSPVPWWPGTRNCRACGFRDSTASALAARKSANRSIEGGSWSRRRTPSSTSPRRSKPGRRSISSA